MKMMKLKKLLAAAAAAFCCVSFAGCSMVSNMNGAVIDSKITSASSTANQIRNITTTWLAEMDADKAWYKGGDKTLTIAVDGGTWTMNNADHSGADWEDGEDHWGTSCSGSYENKDIYFVEFAADTMPDLKKAYFEIHIVGGRVIGVSYVPDVTGGVSLPTAQDFENGTFSGFDGKAGLMKDGTVVGTSPSLAMG